MMEWLFATYAARSASRIVGRLAGVPLPPRVLRPVIKAYSVAMGVAAEETAEPPGGFASFGDFFARRLKPDARPVCAEDGAAVSPCDGELVAFGAIETRPSPQLLVKGYGYTVAELLGAEAEAARFAGGGYCVIYLHPRDYHRVHLPAAGALLTVRRIPGARFPVARWAEERVAGVYEKNERAVFVFELETGAHLAIAMVAAFGVGDIDTPFDPACGARLPVRREREMQPPILLSRGQEVGAFRLGSTVVLLWSEGALRLDAALVRGPVVMGRRLGRVVPRTKPV